MIPPQGPRDTPRRGDFYRSRAWRFVRMKVLKEHHFECQACKSRGRYTPATLVHHELPLDEYPEYGLTPQLPDGTPQLIPLCFECHEEIETERGNRPGQAEPLTEEWW